MSNGPETKRDRDDQRGKELRGERGTQFTPQQQAEIKKEAMGAAARRQNGHLGPQQLRAIEAEVQAGLYQEQGGGIKK